MKHFADRTILHTSYLEDVMNPAVFNKTLRDLCTFIKRHFPDVPNIAFRGSSGCLVGMVLCTRLKKKPMLVRKQDGNHSSFAVEGSHIGDYIIVDDLVASGKTVRNIVETIYAECGTAGEVKGVVCYTRRYNSGRPVDDVSYRCGTNSGEVQVYGSKDIGKIPNPDYEA